MNFSFKNSIPLPFLQASHPAHVPPVQWSCLAGIRSGIPPARCGNEARGLVDHERSALQFSRCWGLCASGGSLNELPEPAGADSSQVICRSWNRGRCSAQFASCQFAHRCSTCAGSHRASECSRRFDKTSSHDRKRRSASPPSVPSSTSKTRR